MDRFSKALSHLAVSADFADAAALATSDAARHAVTAA